MKKLREKVEKLEMVVKLQKMQSISRQKHDAKIVASEDEIIELVKQGYNCQPMGHLF